MMSLASQTSTASGENGMSGTHGLLATDVQSEKVKRRRHLSLSTSGETNSMSDYIGKG